MKKLFTERHGGAKPRIAEELDPVTREALINLVASRIDEEWFGFSFADKCGDGWAYAGTDRERLRRTMSGFDVVWPADHLRRPSPYSDDETAAITDGAVFDLLEFSYEQIAQPDEGSFHSYGSHMHYTYDQEAGRYRFAEDVNRLFERNGIAFELREGEIVRLAPTGLQEALAATVFRTGDTHLDEMLEAARTKFLHRDLNIRRESLEKLWDAWERLKTIEEGTNKPAMVKALLDKGAAEPNFRQLIEAEARALTDIGNNFMIRHTETTKTPISESAHVDYLFHRLFSLIRLLLKASNRGG
jgi:hypothetical protein